MTVIDQSIHASIHPTTEDEYTFEDYLADFPDKSYADAAERALREAVFAKRLAAIQHHNTHLAGKSKGYRKVRVALCCGCVPIDRTAGLL